MPIGEQTPIASHTGNGVATVFAYSFGVLAADDIKVLVDGAEVTTGFTVSGIGSRTGGTVTFSVAPTSGADILIVREVVRKRDTDYQYSGDLREEVLDDDLDRIWMTLQEDGELVDRGVRVPVGETLSELPAAASRVDKVLTFGAGGAVALVDIAAFSGGGVVELIPADDSITTAKLAAGAVTTSKLADDSVTAAKIAAGAVGSSELADDSVTASKIAAGAVTTSELGSEAVTQAKVANGVGRMTLAASQATTSGTAIDFTGIPSWAKRITGMLHGVSTNGSSAVTVQAGAGSIDVTGYAGSAGYTGTASAAGLLANGFATETASSSSVTRHGHFTLTHLGGDVWVFSSVQGRSDSAYMHIGGGSKAFSGTIDRIRLTATNGTDTFDAGSVTLLIEG